MRRYAFTIIFISICTALNAQVECIDPNQINLNIMCPAIYDPVCGCNGVTYSNSCEAANHAGVTSWTSGVCPAICPQLPDNVSFGDCEMALGWILTSSGCVMMSGCSMIGSDGINYESYFYQGQSFCENQCQEPIECIDPGQIDESVICTAIWDPVCGCDGVTYSNSCEAINHGGVTSYSAGECPEPHECDPLSPDVNFGLCAMALGWIMYEGGCVSVSGCGTVGSDGVDYAPYFFQNEYQCNSQCISPGECVNPEQIDITMNCFDIWAPVCGCNGITYANDCEAFYHGGVTMSTPGECPPPENDCYDVGNLDFGPCDAFLGFAYMGSSCSGISGCGYVVDGIDYSPYFFNNVEDCNSACENYIPGCINPGQVNIGIFCINLWDPVCGCDNVTYSNTCFAFYHGGVTSWTPGECPLGIGAISRDEFLMYPNPATDQLNISFRENGNRLIRILDTTGKQCFRTVTKGQSNILIDLSDIPSGSYILEIQGDSGRTDHQRFIRL